MPSSDPISSLAIGADLTQQTGSAAIDLQRVRRLFANTKKIAAADFLRREIASRMHERLDIMRLTPLSLLDAGCGTGADLPLLQQRFDKAHLLGLDASQQQLQQAVTNHAQTQSGLRRNLGKWLSKLRADGSAPSWICGDFARLPLKAQSLDMVWSNLALHWHPQPDVVFAEWQRVLRAEGLLMFSCFGPDSLRQLRDAMLQIGSTPAQHILPFVDMHDLGDMLIAAGFATPVMDMEMLTITYTSVEKLLADVRALGGNPLANQRRGLRARQFGVDLRQALLQQMDANGKICLNFEIIYGHAFRPLARQTAAGEAIIHFSKQRSDRL